MAIISSHRFGVSGELLGKLNEELMAAQSLDESESSVLRAAVQLCRDDGHRGNSVQLLQQLEPVRVLELEVDPEHDDLQQRVQYGPCLRLEQCWDEVGYKETQ